MSIVGSLLIDVKSSILTGTLKINILIEIGTNNSNDTLNVYVVHNPFKT